MTKQMRNNCCLCCQDMTCVMPAICCARSGRLSAFD